MENLEYLSVSSNNLTDLHGVPKNVRYVQASYNEITGLLGLKDADKLESLVASQNKIVSADGLENKKNLR